MRRPCSTIFVASLVGSVFCIALAGCQPSSPTVPDTPAGTVQAFHENMAEGKPEIIWAMLPASYQKEVQDDIVKAFAAKIDPEIHSKGVAVAKKLTALLREKKDLIVPMVTANPMFQMAQVDAAKFTQNWEKAVGLLDTLLASEIGDLSRLKNADVGSFLRVTGGKLMRQFSELSALSDQDPYKKNFQTKMKGAKIEVLKTEGDKATVKVSYPAGEEETSEMVKVEGKWLPKEMVDGWKEAMTSAKTQIAGIDKTMAEAKPQVMGMLAGVETALDQLSAAKTPEEFGKAAAGIMGNLPFPMGMPGGGDDELQPGKE